MLSTNLKTPTLHKKDRLLRRHRQPKPNPCPHISSITTKPHSLQTYTKTLWIWVHVLPTTFHQQHKIPLPHQSQLSHIHQNILVCHEKDIRSPIFEKGNVNRPLHQQHEHTQNSSFASEA